MLKMRYLIEPHSTAEAGILPILQVKRLRNGDFQASSKVTWLEAGKA